MSSSAAQHSLINRKFSVQLRMNTGVISTDHLWCSFKKEKAYLPCPLPFILNESVVLLLCNTGCLPLYPLAVQPQSGPLDRLRIGNRDRMAHIGADCSHTAGVSVTGGVQSREDLTGGTHSKQLVAIVKVTFLMNGHRYFSGESRGPYSAKCSSLQSYRLC